MNTNKSYVLRITAFVTGAFVLSHLLFLLFPHLFEIWNLQTNDYLFRLRYQVYKENPKYWKKNISPYIVHVDVNDSSFQKLGIIDRTTDAKVIDILTEAYTAAIAYDIIFLSTANDSKDDEALINATIRSGHIYYPIILRLKEFNVVYAQESITPDEALLLKKNLWYPKTTRRDKEIEAVSAIPTFVELGKSARGIGHINIYPDRDGVYRRIPLLIRFLDGYIPSLTFRLVCDYLHVPSQDIEVSFGEHIILHKAEFPYDIKKDIVIPIDERGNVIINFQGPWGNSFPHYSIQDLMEKWKNEKLRNKIEGALEDSLVIVSDVSTRGRDIGPVPVDKIYPLSGIHANLINSILTENFLRDFSVWEMILVDFFLVFFLCLFAVKLRSVSFWLSCILIFLIFLSFVGWLFFYHNTLTNIIRPTLGFVFSLVAVNVYSYVVEEREKSFIRSLFESYFAPSVLKKIIQSPDKLETSEKKTLTVLFTDIVGFTSWCASKKPEEIRSTLNDYFDEMTKIIFKYEGTIDKYIGDGLMVFFGDPFEQPDHAIRAVKASIEMQQKTHELKERWQAQKRLPIQIRIGINTGDMVVGNMGPKKRMAYTVIGANVNLAQRLESKAASGEILVSETVFEQVKDLIDAKYIGKITVKGIKDEFGVYEIIMRKAP